MRLFISFLIYSLLCINLLVTASDQNTALNTDSSYWIDEDLNSLRNEKFICISLGSMCFPGVHLTDHGLHLRSYPFDWNITPFQALYRILQNDFVDFFNLAYMKTSTNWEEIINTKYHFSFCHTVLSKYCYDGQNGLQGLNEEGILHLQNMETLFDRRVKRFRAVLNLGVPIYFFRHDRITPSQAIKLKHLIEDKYPNCIFTLVVTHEWDDGNNWTFAEREGIRHIILKPEFNLSKRKPNQQRHPAFTRVFKKLGLL
jgi:hypothetical protein